MGCALARVCQKSTLRLSGIQIDSSRLMAGGVWKDLFVRANLVVRTTAEELIAAEEAAKHADDDADVPSPMALRVEPGCTAKTSTRPKPTNLDWGAEAITLELPGPAQLPLFVQLLVRAKDGAGTGVTLGHTLACIDSLNGSLTVSMLDEADMAEAGYSLPPSPPGSEPPSPPSTSPPPTRPPSPPPSPPSCSTLPSPCASPLPSHRPPPPLLALPPPGAAPPSPCPSPPPLDRPMTAPDGRGRGGEGSGSGMDGRPQTAGELGSQKPVSPITTTQAQDLLKVEFTHAERAVMMGKATESADAIQMRFSFVVSTPFPALAPDFLRTRQDLLREEAMGSGAADASDKKPSSEMSGPRPLGGFSQVNATDRH